jgi:alkylation response protein AidB-like acyl-CoA dehydrogenase
MISGGCDLYASLLSPESYEQVYRRGPDVIIAGSAQPAGTADATAGGWRVNGRWPFASSCQHADWIFGFCIMTEDGKPLAGEDGAPLVRGFLLPARRVAAGLRAARAFHRAQVASHWRHALAGTLKDEALLTQGTQAAIWVATACVGVADACFTLAGGSAIYESSPLRRRMRDLHVAAQHAAVQQRHYVSADKQLLGGSAVAKSAGSSTAGDWPAAARPSVYRAADRGRHRGAKAATGLVTAVDSHPPLCLDTCGL